MNDIQQPKIADQRNILLQISNFAGGVEPFLLCENLKNLTHFTGAFYRRRSVLCPEPVTYRCIIPMPLQRHWN